MNNFFAKFGKILDVCKHFSQSLVNAHGNMPLRGVVPQISYLEVIALALTAETESIAIESRLISMLKSHSELMPNLISRRQYNSRRKYPACQVTQTLNYLPYGEDWVDIQNNLDPNLGMYTYNGKDPRKGWRIPLDEIKYNEQRDEEKEMSGGHFASERGEEPRSGMQYCSSLSFTNFGARYMDHELMTMWLSVDPMADKYPGISPYAYCAWNPVKLVDPNGEEAIMNDDIVIKGTNNSNITIKTDAINLEFCVNHDFGGNQVIADLSQVAIGYEGGVNGTAAAVFGTSYSGYAQNVKFLGGDYANYWYTYVGGEAQMNGSTSVEASIGTQANWFIAIHDPQKGKVTPSSFAGEYFGGQCGIGASCLGGIDVNIALSQSADKQWTMLSFGFSLSVSPQFGGGVSAGGQIGGTKLLTSEVPTRQRSFADKLWNKCTHKMFPIPGL